MENLLRDNKEKLFAFLDFETENLCLSSCCNKPWQASMILYRNNKIEKELDFYIKWPEGLNVSKEAARHTNFNPETVERLGKSPEEVLDNLDKCFNEADVIAGHNLFGFDVYIAQGFYKKLNRPSYNIVPKLLDTFALAKAYKLEIPYNPKENFQAWQYRMVHRIEKGVKTSLGVLAREFGIAHDPTQLHNALVDLRVNVGVWDKLKYAVNIKE